jgi:hypothetical protein
MLHAITIRLYCPARLMRALSSSSHTNKYTHNTLITEQTFSAFRSVPKEYPYYKKYSGVLVVCTDTGSPRRGAGSNCRN